MLATLEDAPLDDPSLVYEPKYDGIRALIEINPRDRSPVRIWSRLGNDKTAQFPEIVSALAHFAKKKKLKDPVVLDGEIVALDESGNPAGFQRLQNRIHLTELDGHSVLGHVALIAFDILRDRDEDLRPLPLTERRARLERLFGNPGSTTLRLSEAAAGNGDALYQRALEHGWEGLIAKSVSSVYHTGKRTRDWRKVKLVHEQEFVVGGWTDARTTGRPFGALLLGYYENGRLEYAGHTGSGFNQRELERVYRLLKPLEIEAPPFRVRPRTNQRPHWAKPSLVAQLKFTEWTDDGILRHPIYLGLRDDVKPAMVRREKKSAPTPRAPGQKAVLSSEPRRLGVESQTSADVQSVIHQLTEIEQGRKSGLLHLPDGHTLEVTNLNKVFWPKLKITKGELMRYYAHVAKHILPVVDDRPLIMKRFPNGIEGKAFYQQRAPEQAPTGVRIVTIPGDEEVPSRVIGGNLLTLLYTTQLAAISQDPWFSRVTSPHTADHCAIDLDPMPGVKFASVLDVARWVHEELDKLKVTAFPKTSGSRGVHIYIPLREGTPYEAGMIFCQIVATIVAEKHPKIATVQRTVRARGQKVYVDYLQNIEGKSLACAYSARASDFAGVSTPVTWKELDEAIDPADFTIRTMPARLQRTGDLWAPLLASKGFDLRKILDR
jgi:bifunctional non-homologous end joining protein LigD